jgi:hypothetical protein
MLGKWSDLVPVLLPSKSFLNLVLCIPAIVIFQIKSKFFEKITEYLNTIRSHVKK